MVTGVRGQGASPCLSMFYEVIMKVEDELKALRYLINDLILYIYDLRVKLDEISPSARRYKTREPNPNGDTIGFDLFNLKRKQYDDLINKYGVDAVNKACVKLDEFVKLNEYIPYGNANNALDKRFIKEVIKEDYNGRVSDTEECIES